MSNEQIKHMVDRFLQWKLPENFNPDGGISFKKTFNENAPWGPMTHEPVGTNLFDAVQAEAMVRYMVNGLPAERGEPAAEPPCGCTRDFVCTQHIVTPEQTEQTRAKLAEAIASARASMAAAPAPVAPLDLFEGFVRLQANPHLHADILRWEAKRNARLSAELEQVRRALKAFEHVENEPVSATAEVAAESYSFLENERNSLRRELEQVQRYKAEKDRIWQIVGVPPKACVGEVLQAVEQVRKAFRNYLAGAISKRAAEVALGEKGKQ